jgi:Rrf2 family transcriptional regulator, nitric oxide-sensitive transcriptional repressor
MLFRANGAKRMQLTKFSDYALRVLIYLAQREGEQVTIAEIATAHAISENHLMKVVSRLGQTGYLATTRGKGGGIRLARPAVTISVGAVVRDVEPMTAVECFAADYDGACRLWPRCSLMTVIRKAQREFLRSLDGHSLEEISRARA